MSKRYAINEVFYSLQGEGVRAGTPNVFVRFAGCNLTCKQETHGFDCDTEFTSGRKVTLEELFEWIRRESPICKNVILTGGEPGLQVDSELIAALKRERFYVAIETNGTVDLQPLLDAELDWITLSPKVAEHAVKQLWAHELKYVRGYGQAIPRPAASATHYLISPAADGQLIRPDVMQWCIDLVKQNPQWRLSVQLHKVWGVR